MNCVLLRLEIGFATFEDLKTHLPGEVKHIADFLSTNELRYDTKERIKATIDRSTYVYMKEHESQFDEKLSESTRNEACGLSACGCGSFSFRRLYVHSSHSSALCELRGHECETIIS
jgi:hypothetical protein